MSHYVVLQLSLLIYLYCCCCMMLFQLYYACMSTACLLHRRDIHHKKNASRVYINVTTTVVKEFEQKTVDKNRIHFSVIMTKRILLQLLCLSCFRDAHTWNAHHGVSQKAQFMTTSIFALVKHCTINKDRQGYYSSLTR